MWGGFSGMGILEGENSLNWPIGSGNPLTDLWQDALGLPTLPCQSQFDPWCDPSMLPNPWILDGQPFPLELAKAPPRAPGGDCENGLDLTLSMCAAGCAYPSAALGGLSYICGLGGQNPVACYLTAQEESAQANQRCMNNCMKSWAERNKCQGYYTFDQDMR
jgi:hypothetical protein